MFGREHFHRRRSRFDKKKLIQADRRARMIEVASDFKEVDFAILEASLKKGLKPCLS